MTTRATLADLDLSQVRPPGPMPHPELPPVVARTGAPASEIAAQSTITHLRHVGLAMPDFERSLRFYETVWGLYRIADDGDVAFLGAIGSPEPFIVRLRRAPESRTDLIAFGARDRAGVDQLAASMGAAGERLLSEPAALKTPGGGYGFRFHDPDGRTIEVSTDVCSKPFRELGPRESVPRKISHVVINSPDVVRLQMWYEKHLGFRLSDWLEDKMCFLRCSDEHHNLAIAHRSSANLNHISFEMRGVEEYMRGTGRLIRHGVPPLWGPGRHSAGDNVYAYFADPDRNVVEYTTELERIPDEDNWTPRRWSMANAYADRWGTAGTGEDLFVLGASSGPDAGLWRPSPL